MNPPALWRPLGNVSPRRLVEARLTSHHAVQVVAAVGRCWARPRADDGHTSLAWRDETSSLSGQEVPGPRPWRAELRLLDLSLSVSVAGEARERLSLVGKTSAEAGEWLRRVGGDLGAPVDRWEPTPSYALPGHAVAEGAPFGLPADGTLEELAAWFANADALLRAAAGEWRDAAPVRLWPHHFDVGSVLPLGGGAGEEAPSIGVGLSPGDEGRPEPYLYVTPWPRPRADTLPALPAGGSWNVEGWVGAVLTATEVVAAGAAPAQAAVATAFMAGAIDVLRERHLGA